MLIQNEDMLSVTQLAAKYEEISAEAAAATRQLYQLSRRAMDKALDLASAKRFAEADLVLEVLGLDGAAASWHESEPFWHLAIRSKNDALDLDIWNWVARTFPLAHTASLDGYFGQALRKGSSTIVSALLPLYTDALWHYNWSADNALVPAVWLAAPIPYGELQIKAELQLAERLKTFSLLLDSGCQRFGLSLSRLAEYSYLQGLSDETKILLERTYIQCLELQLAQEGLEVFGYGARSRQPSDQLPEAAVRFREGVRAYLASSAEVSVG